MFKTIVGALGGEEDAAFLRPETAQGIFVNFKNVLDSTRVKVPFGIAQMGKSFRNEITPRNFTFRSREFEQMEIEFFCHPNESPAVVPATGATAGIKWYIDLGLAERAAAAARARRRRAEPLLVRHGRHRVRLPVPAAGRVRRAGRHRPPRRLRPPQPHGRQARPARTSELVVEQDADGKPKHRGSGKDLTYLDDSTSERFMPHVIEPSAGADRGDAGVPLRGLPRGQAPRREGRACRRAS